MAGRADWLRGVIVPLAATLLACAGSGSAVPPTPPDDPLADALRRELEASQAASKDPAPGLPAPARAPVAAPGGVWLEVERPAVGSRPVHGAWLEVRGFAGARGRRVYDVVVVLDVSGSTQYASGADVNGNGVVGKRRRRIEPWRVRSREDYCSDPGDTVLDAEREATRRLIERLDPRRTRIGLVAFSDLARPRAALGSSRELLGLVLDDMEGAFGAGPTNLAEATRLATRMLREASGPSAPDPVVLILSDGYPTHPVSEEAAAAAAREAAREAAASGIRVSSFALGIDEPREPDVFAEMARLTGGEHVRVSTPADVVEALPGIDLAQVDDLGIENLTTQESARALRLRPDGRYDAWVRLRPGENRLRVTARGSRGGRSSLERVVVYDDSVPLAPGEAERIRKAIELRTLEMELEREARAARAAQRKVLHVEPRPGPTRE